MTLTDVENALEAGLELVGKLAPLAAVGGPGAGAAGALVGQIATFAASIVPQIENDATVIAGGDLTKLKTLQAQLEAQNAKLAAQIASS